MGISYCNCFKSQKENEELLDNNCDDIINTNSKTGKIVISKGALLVQDSEDNAYCKRNTFGLVNRDKPKSLSNKLSERTDYEFIEACCIVSILIRQKKR
jgi:hypothetical protein